MLAAREGCSGETPMVPKGGRHRGFSFVARNECGYMRKSPDRGNARTPCRRPQGNKRGGLRRSGGS